MTNHTGPILAQRDGLTVIRCRTCGYAHLDPLPEVADLRALYADGFWEREKAGELAHYREQAEWWRMTHNDWLGVLESANGGQPGALLDVGAGYGMFLERALRRGWDALGIEPSLTAAEYADPEGRRVFRGAFEDYKPGWMGVNRFDAVTALWVLEHLTDPLAFLDRCRGLLKPRGLLMLVVPNEWTMAQARANTVTARPYWWLDKTHVNYFDWTSLANLLGLRGFRIVDRLSTYPMENFIVADGMDYPAHPGMGRDLHRRVEQAEIAVTSDERIALSSERACIGVGRDIVAIARME